MPKKVLSFSPLVRLAANAGTGMMWYSKMLAARLLPLHNQHTFQIQNTTNTEHSFTDSGLNSKSAHNARGGLTEQ